MSKVERIAAVFVSGALSWHASGQVIANATTNLQFDEFSGVAQGDVEVTDEKTDSVYFLDLFQAGEPGYEISDTFGTSASFSNDFSASTGTSFSVRATDAEVNVNMSSWARTAVGSNAGADDVSFGLNSTFIEQNIVLGELDDLESAPWVEVSIRTLFESTGSEAASRSSLYVGLGGLSGVNSFVVRDDDDPFETRFVTQLLDGTDRLQWAARVYMQNQSGLEFGESSESFASIDTGVRVIPSPASGVVCGLAGLFAVRRKR